MTPKDEARELKPEGNHHPYCVHRYQEFIKPLGNNNWICICNLMKDYDAWNTRPQKAVDDWSIEKRREQAEWLKKRIGAMELVCKYIDQAFEVEEKSLEEEINSIRRSDRSYADSTKEIIQAVKSHYGIKE